MPLDAISVTSIQYWLVKNRILLLRALVVCGVLFISGYIGIRGTEGRAFKLLSAAILLPCLLSLIQKPSLGLMLLVVAAQIVPVGIGTGTNSEINIAMLVVAMLIGLWVLDMMVRRDVRLLPSRAIPPLLAFASTALIAFLAGNQPWLALAETAPFGAQVGGLAIFLLSVGTFLVAAHQFRDVVWLRRTTWLFLALGALYIFGRLVPALGSFTRSRFQWGADGSVFWIWLAALAFSQAVFNRKLHPAWRIALAVLLLATFTVSWFQDRAWSAGWLPMLVAVIGTLWAGAPRLALPVTVVSGFFLAWQQGNVHSSVMVGDNEYSLMTRLVAWHIMMDVIKLNPVLGLGPANYYWYTPLFPILGYTAQFNSHNQYVDLLAQTGFLGLACFLWFACALGILGWRLRTKVQQGFPQAYVYGALGGLAGTLATAMLADWVIPFVYNIGLKGFRASVLGWLFLGGLVALEAIAREERKTDRTG